MNNKASPRRLAFANNPPLAASGIPTGGQRDLFLGCTYLYGRVAAQEKQQERSSLSPHSPWSHYLYGYRRPSSEVKGWAASGSRSLILVT